MNTRRLLLFVFIFAKILPATAEYMVGDDPVKIGDLYYNFDRKNYHAKVVCTDGYYGGNYFGDVTIPSEVVFQGNIYVVADIGYRAFYKCSSLSSVIIPKSIANIDKEAFRECGLTSIVVETGNINYDCRWNCNAIIESSTNTLIAGSSNTVIPESVTSIGEYAFDSRKDLSFITIPNSVTSIGGSAFRNCTGLTSVTIPESVTSIGDFTFSGCSGLASVTIGSSMTSIGKQAFDGCSGLTSVTIPNSVTSIGVGAFSNCTGLTSVTIPESVTSIGGSAFQDCSGLTSINIPNSVTCIEGYTFKGCSGLNSVTIGSGVTSIKNNAFDGCENLSVTFHCLKIESWFGGNSSFKTSIKTVIIGEEVISIADLAFKGCSSLTSVTIGSGVTSITSIGSNAFAGCNSLTSVTIPNSVTSIGQDAFNCGGLKEVYCYGEDVSGYESTAFNKRSASAILHIHDKLINSFKNLWPYFYHYKGLDNIDFILTYYVEGEKYKSVKYKYDDVITPEPWPQKDGYNFSGWEGLRGKMPANDLDVSGSFVKSRFRLTYKVDGKEYKVYDIDEKTDITPESYPTKKGMTFSGWKDLPEKMPSKDVEVTGTFSWSKSTVGSVIYQVTDTISNYCSVIGNEDVSGAVKIESSVDFDYNYTVTNVVDKAFYNCKEITTLEIPETVTDIGERTFANIDILTDVTCMSENLPNIDRTAFENSYIEDYVTLHVPESALEKYRSAAPWKNFKEVVGFSAPTGPNKCATPSASIVNGKMLFACETEGVTYHYNVSCSFEREGEGDNIELDNVYKVTVYASKEGYIDSEVLTKEVSASQLDYDLNGDKKINVSDIVKMVNLMLEGE